MKKNGLITLISILAAAAGAIAAIFAITKKIGKKKDAENEDIIEGPDGHIEIDIDDNDDFFGVSEEEYQSQSAEIPAQEFEDDDTSDVSPDKVDDEDEDREEKAQD